MEQARRQRNQAYDPWVSKALAKVNSAESNPRFVIALHSPIALLETGLRICLPEKSRDRTASDAGQSILSGPVCV